MKRVLVYSNRKCEPIYWDASTEELEAGAFLELFKVLDGGWGSYSSLKEEIKPYGTLPKDHPEGCMCDNCKSYRERLKNIPREEAQRIAQMALYRLAKNGDADAARKLLLKRREEGGYEDFKFEPVHSAAAAYAPRIWGVQKPCGEAFIADNGVFIWSRHGEYSPGVVPGRRVGYHFKGTVKEAIQYLTNAFHFDPKSKKSMDLGEEVWEFAPKKPDQDNDDWLHRALGADTGTTTDLQGLEILQAGSMKPGTVTHMTQPVCGGCRRDMNRFAEE